MPLEEFAPLAGRKEVCLFSLQKDFGSEQLAAEKTAWKIKDLGPQLTSWLDTAAVISELDLVVSVDTAVAHLAGALAKPVWVLLPFVPDWRGCWTARTLPGIRPCACSANADEATGRKC